MDQKNDIKDEFSLDEEVGKKLFADVRHCNFTDISQRIHKLGGKSIINILRSPYGKSKQRIWMSVTWKNNKATSLEKKKFIKQLEEVFTPNFDLMNEFKCNIIHDLCFSNRSVDIDTSFVVLKYFISESKCISKKSFSIQDNAKRTPLHYAVLNNKFKCCELLLPFYNKNDITNLKDKHNKSIIEYSGKYQNINTMLLSYCKENKKNKTVTELEYVDSILDDAKYDDEEIKEVEEFVKAEKSAINKAFTEITKIISKYKPEEYAKSITTDSNKQHLRGLNLDKKQLKTSYCLENQTLEFIFHLFYDGNCEETYQQPIAFWATYNIVDDLVRNNFQNINKNNIINYKIGALNIDKLNDEPLFIKGVFNALRQSNGIQQPFHITIIKTLNTNISSKTNPDNAGKTQCNVTNFADGLSIPIQAILPSYKKLYPLQVYEENDNDYVQFDVVRDIKASSSKGIFSMLNRNKYTDLKVEITDRLIIIIPSTERGHNFKIKVYPISIEYMNDIRFQILCDNEYIIKKNKKPIKIQWKLDNYKYKKNIMNENQQLFKIYFNIKLLNNVWCTGSKNQMNILNNAHPIHLYNNNDYYIESEIYGAYDMYLREQINFYDQYIDKFCLNSKYNEDYTNALKSDLQKYNKGGKPYYKPKGWKVFGINNQRNSATNLIYHSGCIAYHSTSITLLPSILRDGLVVPGTTLSMTGYRLPIPPGHITVSSVSGIDDNDFTNNVFASPSINYCSYSAYCKSFELSKYNKYNKKYVHLALKLYVKPDSIRTNRETIGWSRKSQSKIDPNFSNNELEWRIREPKDVLITGLCIYESNITNKNIWKIKKKMRDNNNLIHEIRNIFDLKNVFYLNIIDKTDPQNFVNIKLNKLLLPNVLIKNIKKMYLKQINDQDTKIEEVYFCDKNLNNIIMNDNKSLNDYNINKTHSDICVTFKPNTCNICLSLIKRKDLVRLGCCRASLHNKCLKDFIKSKSIKPGNKISLQQLSCFICRNQMKHKLWQHLFASIDVLYNKLKIIALNQLQYDNQSNHKEIINPNGVFYNNPNGFAMKHYSFYICFKCSKPYCSGENNCIQEMKEQESIKSEERLCLDCRPPIIGFNDDLQIAIRCMVGFGLWLCPNNHVYFIDGCISTYQAANCSTCGAPIGNMKSAKTHNAAKGNRLVGKIGPNGEITPLLYDPYVKKDYPVTDISTFLYQFSSKIN